MHSRTEPKAHTLSHKSTPMEQFHICWMKRWLTESTSVESSHTIHHLSITWSFIVEDPTSSLNCQLPSAIQLSPIVLVPPCVRRRRVWHAWNLTITHTPHLSNVTVNDRHHKHCCVLALCPASLGSNLVAPPNLSRSSETYENFISWEPLNYCQLRRINYLT